MSYATRADMIDRFGEDELIQLTDRSGAGVIDDTVLDRALADADAEIDGFLQARYSLPLSHVPALIVRIACIIARYNLYEDMATDEVRRRYEDATRMLKSISRGEINLGVSETTGPATTSGPVTTTRTRTFTDDTLRDY